MSNSLSQIKRNIESTLNYSLSLSNMELYHSNLLAFVIEKTKFVKHEFFANVIDIKKDYKEINVYREKNSIDVTIVLKNLEDEVSTIFIENKIKSVPKLDQLKRYSEYKTFNKGILLSLILPLFIEPDGWVFKGYTDLLEYYKAVINIIEDDKLLKGFLSDYIKYIEELNKLIILLKDDKNYYLDEEKYNELNNMRLVSMLSKMKYSYIENELSNKLQKDTYSGRIRGDGHFGVVIPLYISSPQIDYQTDKLKIDIDIQIEGKQYRHKINFPSELENYNLIDICKLLKSETILFNFNIDDDSILMKSNSRQDWKKYGTHYYDYALIKEETKVNELLDYIVKDFEDISSNLDKIKCKISSGIKKI